MYSSKHIFSSSEMNRNPLVEAVLLWEAAAATAVTFVAMESLQGNSNQEVR